MKQLKLSVSKWMNILWKNLHAILLVVCRHLEVLGRCIHDYQSTVVGRKNQEMLCSDHRKLLFSAVSLDLFCGQWGINKGFMRLLALDSANEKLEDTSQFSGKLCNVVKQLYKIYFANEDTKAYLLMAVMCLLRPYFVPGIEYSKYFNALSPLILAAFRTQEGIALFSFSFYQRGNLRFWEMQHIIQDWILDL